MIKFKKIKTNLKEKLPKLTEIFQQNKKINAFFLFGSYAENKLKPLSDIDLALLLKKNVARSVFWDLKIDFLNQAVKILGTEEIDFVLLNEAPSDLAYNILKTGKILFCQKEKELIEFREKIVLDYLDTQNLREEGLFHLLERVRNGSFGYD